MGSKPIIGKGGSEETEGKREEKPSKIIIDILWEIREDVALMKQGLGIKNIIAEIKNSAKSWNVDDTAQEIEWKGRDSKHERKREIRSSMEGVQNLVS